MYHEQIISLYSRHILAKTIVYTMRTMLCNEISIITSFYFFVNSFLGKYLVPGQAKTDVWSEI